MTRVCTCLLLALICGLILGFLQVTAQGTTYNPWFNGRWVLPLWLPFALGIIASISTFTAVRRVGAHIWLSIATGLLTWIGIAVWWFPIAAKEDAAFNASCLHRYCHVSGLEGVGLFIYVLSGIVVALFGAVVCSLLLWPIHSHKKRHTTSK